jgi:hypothetical protein
VFPARMPRHTKRIADLVGLFCVQVARFPNGLREVGFTDGMGQSPAPETMLACK